VSVLHPAVMQFRAHVVGKLQLGFAIKT